jgi:signal transduction histidine kinase
VSADAELAREGIARRAQPLPARRAVTEVVAGGAFVAAAVLLATLAKADRSFEVGPTIALVLMFAVGIRVQIDVGVAYTSPVQLAFVPMLLLLPTPLVPLLVLFAWLLGRLPRLLGDMHPDRLLLIPGDCWFAIGPALVLVLGDAQTPDWSHWPLYLLALLAQFGLEALTNYVREWIGEGVAPRIVLHELGVIWAIDALLSPLGMLAAFASASFQYAFLLLIAPVGLLGFYAREREGRLRSAMALADAAHDREGLIAGASHELVTPLGVLVGLTGHLTGGAQLAPDRRAELDTVMRREVLALRQVVRQFVDYTRLKTERDLQISPSPTQLEPLVADVVVALQGLGRVGVVPTEVLPAALVDPDRAHQMIMGITAEALEGATEVQVELMAGADAISLVVTSPHAPRERPFAEGGEGSGAGLGLYVTRELARRQGGELTANAAGTGARYVLSLPVASGGHG